MTKRDRKAVVVSIGGLVLTAMLAIPNSPLRLTLFIWLLLLIVYWGYRFISNDISFFKVRDSDE